MRLSTKGRYAVMAMVDLATLKGRPVALSDIAARQGLPLPYLEQIFSKLKQKGVVQSVRGPKGGYVLVQEAQAVSIASVIHAVGEEIQATQCRGGGVQGKGCLPNSAKCRTHHLWTALERQVIAYLKSISLADISGFETEEFFS